RIADYLKDSAKMSKIIRRNYSAIIKNQERSQDSVLTIPFVDDRSIDYEFTVVKENGIPYICTRSKQYRDFQYYAMYASSLHSPGCMTIGDIIVTIAIIIMYD